MIIMSSDDKQVDILLRQLSDEDDRVCIVAINELGNVGDELCLKGLRERLKYLNIEHQALIIAVGKLKNKLGIK
jgi:hypothetical protein